MTALNTTDTLPLHTNSDQWPPQPSSDETRINLAFNSTALAALTAILFMAFSTILIIPAAWGAAYFYRWAIKSTTLSNGTQVRFAGNPKDIWLIFAANSFLSMLPSFFDMAVTTQTSEKYAWVISLAVLPLQVIFNIKIFKWLFSNIETSTGSKMTFTGTAWGYFGWMLIMILSIFTIVGWAWASVAITKWFCTKVESENHRFEFNLTGWDMLWRSVVFILGCCLIIPIPWLVVWYNKWFMAGFVIVRTAAK